MFKENSSSDSNRLKRKRQNDDNGNKKNKATDGNNNDSPSKSSASFKYPEWRLTPPAEGESTTKEVDGKTFHWCSKDHGRTKGGLWGKEVDHKSPHSCPHKSDNKSVSFADAVKSNDKSLDASKESPASNLKLDRKSLLAQASALKNSSFYSQFVGQEN